MRPRNSTKKTKERERESSNFLVGWGLESWPPTTTHHKKTTANVKERIKIKEEGFTIEEGVDNEGVGDGEEDGDGRVIETGGEVVDGAEHAAKPMVDNRAKHLDLDGDEERNMKKLITKLSIF